MKKFAMVSLLTLAPMVALADPGLIATADGKGGVVFEFVADPANPVTALGIHLNLGPEAAKGKVAEECFKAPKGFSALCNIDGQMFKAVVYSANPNAAMPTGTLGHVTFPAGALTYAKSGELTGLKVSAVNGEAAAVQSEVLSQTK